MGLSLSVIVHGLTQALSLPSIVELQLAVEEVVGKIRDPSTDTHLLAQAVGLDHAGQVALQDKSPPRPLTQT